jgi:hypothetical protein
MRSNSVDVLPVSKIRIYKGDNLNLSITKTEGVSWTAFLEESNMEKRVVTAIKAGQQSTAEELAKRICSIFREYTKTYSNEWMLSSSGIIHSHPNERQANQPHSKSQCSKSDPVSSFGLIEDFGNRRLPSNHLQSFASKPDWETSAKDQAFGLNNLKISVGRILDGIKPNLLEEEIHHLRKDIRDCFNDLNNARKFFKALIKLAEQIIPEEDVENVTNNVHNLWRWLKGFLERYLDTYKVGLKEPRDGWLLKALGCEDWKGAARKVERLLEDSRRLWEVRTQVGRHRREQGEQGKERELARLINRILT